MTGTFTWKERLVIAAADLLMLLLGLYGALFSFLSSFPLPMDAASLRVACIPAAAAAVAVFSLPKARHRLPLAFLWLVWLGWLVRENFSALVLAALISAEQVGAVFAGRLNMGLVAPDFSRELAGLTPAARRDLCTLLCVLALFLLALWLGWAVVRRRGFWLGFWGTFPLLLAPLTITVTPRWLPLMALLLFWAVGLLTRLVKKADQRGSAKLTLAALPLTALLLFSLCLALPKGSYERAAWIPKARTDALAELSDLVRDFSLPGGLTGLSGGSTEADLRHAGPLQYTGGTVLRVESEITGHIYLRGFSAGKYTARGWEQLDEATYNDMRDGWEDTLSPVGDPTASSGGGAHIWTATRRGRPDLSFSSVWGPDNQLHLSYLGIGSAQPLNFAAQADQADRPAAPARRFSIEGVGLAPGYMYTPYQLATTPDNMVGGAFADDAYLTRDMGIRRYILYARTDAHDGDRRPNSPDAETELAYRAFVYREYLDIPEELDPGLAQFLRRHGASGLSPVGGGSPLAAARAVAYSLARETAYDPDTPVTPAGEDFVNYFLTTSKRGYCMHYASAATLLLRYLGVPARYVSGYAADVVAGKTVSVPDQNAHAWVEVYVDGYGWAPVEVTPGFSTPSTEAFPEGSPAPAPTGTASPRPDTPRPSRDPLRPEPDEDPGEAEHARGASLRALLPPLALLVLLVSLAARRRLALALRRRKFSSPDVNRAVIAMYLYQQRLLRFHWGVELGERVERLAQKAKFSQHTLTEDERSEMLGQTAWLASQTEILPGWWLRLALRYLWALL